MQPAVIITVVVLILLSSLLVALAVAGGAVVWKRRGSGGTTGEESKPWGDDPPPKATNFFVHPSKGQVFFSKDYNTSVTTANDASVSVGGAGSFVLCEPCTYGDYYFTFEVADLGAYLANINTGFRVHTFKNETLRTSGKTGTCFPNICNEVVLLRKEKLDVAWGPLPWYTCKEGQAKDLLGKLCTPGTDEATGRVQHLDLSALPAANKNSFTIKMSWKGPGSQGVDFQLRAGTDPAGAVFKEWRCVDPLVPSADVNTLLHFSFTGDVPVTISNIVTPQSYYLNYCHTETPAHVYNSSVDDYIYQLVRCKPATNWIPTFLIWKCLGQVSGRFLLIYRQEEPDSQMMVIPYDATINLSGEDMVTKVWPATSFPMAVHVTGPLAPPVAPNPTRGCCISDCNLCGDKNAEYPWAYCSPYEGDKAIKFCEDRGKQYLGFSDGQCTYEQRKGHKYKRAVCYSKDPSLPPAPDVSVCANSGRYC